MRCSENTTRNCLKEAICLDSNRGNVSKTGGFTKFASGEAGKSTGEVSREVLERFLSKKMTAKKLVPV